MKKGSKPPDGSSENFSESKIDTRMHAALSDATRVKIFLVLVHARQSMCVKAVSEVVSDIDYKNVARHLKILAEAGLASRERPTGAKGKEVHYTANIENLQSQLSAILTMLSTEA